jgi:hypothetical protein
MPANTVKVDRTTPFGNPFKTGEKFFDYVIGSVQVVRNNRHAVALFRQHLIMFPNLRARIKRELRGKNLACWCEPGAPCHADVLMKVANQE